LTEGIILLDKPAGQTSFQSLGFLKRELQTGRVGHAGTLDKFAEGLLVVLAGRLTRLCPLASAMDKEYVSVFTFGKQTDTLDPEGELIEEGAVPPRRDIEGVLPTFLGTLSQVPPAYSAIHVDGRRASQAARNGEQVQLPPRNVTIHLLQVLDYRPPDLTLRISCSKGTYVRALARDIAARMQTKAYVSRLRRTRIGAFRVEDAHSPDSFRRDRDVLPPAAFFRASPELGTASVRGQWVQQVSRGIRLDGSQFDDPLPRQGVFGAFAGDELLAVVERSGNAFRYLATFPVGSMAGKLT
jgi:tRNA pseudouridine55 synthase